MTSGNFSENPNAASGPARVWHTAGLSWLGVVVTRCEVGLAALFLWAAYNKLFISANAPQVFSASVEGFKLGLPEVGVRLATSVTPWVEVIAGVLLLLGVWSRAAAWVLAALLVAFIGLIGSALLRGLDLHCGCFGKLSPFCDPNQIGPCNIYQNLILLAMALVIAVTPRHRLVRAPAGA